MTVGEHRSGPDFLTALPEQLFYLVYQVHRRRDQAIEALLKETGVGMMGWRVILAINRMEPCSMNELARYTTIERTTLTRSLDQLVATGLVERETPAKDRRQVLVTLTEKGRSEYSRCFELISIWNRKAVEKMPVARQEEALALLKELLIASLGDNELAEDIATFRYSERLGASRDGR